MRGSHTLRRAVASVLIVAFLALLVSANIPIRSYREAVEPVEDPLLAALGTRQVWSVFAPDPQQVVARLGVRFEYADGSRSTWRIPRGNPFASPYRDYRWLKLADNAARSDAAATGLLVWALRNRALPKPVVSARLVRTVYDVAPPGRPRDQHAPARRGTLLTLELARG